MRRFQRFVDKQLIPRELQDGIGIVPDWCAPRRASPIYLREKREKCQVRAQ